MKRPFAAIGFSMLFSALVFYNISFKAAVTLTIGAAVIFCLLLPFKAMRKNKFILFSLASVIAFSLSFMIFQYEYVSAQKDMKDTVEIRGVICQTPTHSDFAHNYIIKLENKSYKVRYVSEDNRFFNEGDIVCGTVKREMTEYIETDYLDSSLSSRIYLTFFEAEDYRLERTGEFDNLYKLFGKIKGAFTDIAYSYIPSENAGIANAMAIGDRSGISSSTIEQFNYTGSSHLLVVSGLHLSIWALGITKLLQKHRFSRKLSVSLSLCALLFYSALTGFSVSVIRAGAMVGAVIIAKIFHRDADSLNSIGAGVTGIMLANPFSAYSVSLWFTVFSTVGILVLKNPLENWIYSTSAGKRFRNFSILRFIISSAAVSLSATICTLPIFIIKFEFLPWASIIANILMVDTALAVMVTTVAGAFFHCLHITPVARLLYWISGTLGSFLRFCAEKIGLAEWSGLPMANKHYKSFLLIAVLAVIIAYLLRKKAPHIIKTTAVILSFIFVLTALTTTLHDYNTPTIEFCKTDEQAIIHINYKGESIIIGCGDKTTVNNLKYMLNCHGKKSPELLIVTSTNDSTFSHISNYHQVFRFSEIAFCGEKLSMYKEVTQGVKTISIDDDLIIDLSRYEKLIEISYNGKNIVYICDETEENPFKNEKGYDKIITYCDLTELSGDEYTKIGSENIVTIEL